MKLCPAPALKLLLACLTVWFFSVEMVRAEKVDPCYPSEQVSAPVTVWSRWLPRRINQLKAEHAQLREQIATLPQHHLISLSERLGYHSLIDDPGGNNRTEPNRIEITLTWAPLVHAIALAPAFPPGQPHDKTYAFPRRFKIEVAPSNAADFETVVDWMEEDFPDPGPYPVFFSDISQPQVKRVRITVPRTPRESGAAYYALGEIYLFRMTESGAVGANPVVWDSTVVEVSDALVMPPLWAAHYLYDGVAGFGLPLSDETVAADDFMVTYENGEPFTDRVQIQMDLGGLRPVGRIDFWPAAAPYRLALPTFGFPEKVVVEISPDPDFKTVRELKVSDVGRRMYRDNLLSLTGDGYAAQYVRITLEGLSIYKGKPILGLGEISISNNEQVWSTHCKVTAQGMPLKDIEQLPRLVDGYSRNRRILPQGEWIKGLAKRRPLDRRLAVIEQKLELAQTHWRHLQLRASGWGGGMAAACLLAGLGLQRRQRRRVLKNLRWQITRDLHDEVGSSLGSISLTAEQLETKTFDAGMKADLNDLSLMAREACASLREVVWVIDQPTIRLPALLQKLIERAEWVLGGVELLVEMPSNCPDLEVSFLFKRHLIMFFKEVMHNCVRHAQATRVCVGVEIADGQLCLTVRDNGCGFDPVDIKKGWGVSSMRKRAQELGGQMKLESHPGKGTIVALTVPLAVLQGEPSCKYKTSNEL